MNTKLIQMSVHCHCIAPVGTSMTMSIPTILSSDGMSSRRNSVQRKRRIVSHTPRAEGAAWRGADWLRGCPRYVEGFTLMVGRLESWKVRKLVARLNNVRTFQ